MVLHQFYAVVLSNFFSRSLVDKQLQWKSRRNIREYSAWLSRSWIYDRPFFQPLHGVLCTMVDNNVFIYFIIETPIGHRRYVTFCNECGQRLSIVVGHSAWAICWCAREWQLYSLSILYHIDLLFIFPLIFQIVAVILVNYLCIVSFPGMFLNFHLLSTLMAGRYRDRSSGLYGWYNGLSYFGRCCFSNNIWCCLCCIQSKCHTFHSEHFQSNSYDSCSVNCRWCFGKWLEIRPFQWLHLHLQ